MSTFRDPPRLLDHAADPKLRDALRAVVQDTPSTAALELMAERARRAATQPSARVGTAHASKWFKLTLLTCSAGALLYASVRTTEQRAADNPAAVSEMRGEASPAARVVPSANRHAEPSTSRTNTAAFELRSVSAPSPAASVVPAQTTAVAPSRPHHPDAPPTVANKRAPVSSTSPAQRARTFSEHEVPAQTEPRSIPGSRALPSELQLLEAAQRALARDPTGSLELVRQHRSLYPEGVFAQERDVLELEVLSRLGHSRELQYRAQRFLENHPRSPHKSRVEMLLGIEPPHRPE